MTADLARLLVSVPSLNPQLEALQRAARSEAPILIAGEPGTGRTSLARALHAESDRAHGSLVEVDPSIIPSSLFEAEFFGYRPGAFTGAEKAVSGRVARAGGGTLLLDPVEELPLIAQPKLLRLLSERRYVPLGGTEATADVRFLAVCSDRLMERVRAGSFREDLFYRLEVLTFRLPPLRDRPGDLPSLIDALLSDLAQRHGRGQLVLSAPASSWMQEYSWPGNLRELRNVLERALVMSPSDELEPRPPRGAGAGRPRSLAEVERSAIMEALAFTRGHQGRAAEILGISRKALWEKRKRLGLP